MKLNVIGRIRGHRVLFLNVHDEGTDTQFSVFFVFIYVTDIFTSMKYSFQT